MSKNISTPSASTTLLELLQMGAKITFESGRSLKGKTDDGYIKVANDHGSLGVWDMYSSSGVDDAVADLVRDVKGDGIDLHGAELVESEDSDDGQ